MKNKELSRIGGARYRARWMEFRTWVALIPKKVTWSLAAAPGSRGLRHTGAARGAQKAVIPPYAKESPHLLPGIAQGMLRA
jgi:hypothetical protein